MKAWIFFLLSLTVMTVVYQRASYAAPDSCLSGLPVLHEGRIKPIETFARAELKTLSGRDHLPDRDAVAWLTNTIFDPATAIDTPVFLIRSQSLRHRMGLGDDKPWLYALPAIAPGLKATSALLPQLLQKDAKLRTADERALLKLQDDAASYVDLLRSLTIVLPLQLDIPPPYRARLPKNPTYLDLIGIEPQLRRDVASIVSRKGEDIDAYTKDERAAALFAFQVEILASATGKSGTFKVIPPQWQGNDPSWHSPWDMISQGQGSPGSAALIAEWTAMGRAYSGKDWPRFEKSCAALSDSVFAMANKPALAGRIKIEIAYERSSPLGLAALLYGAGLLAALVALRIGGNGRTGFILLIAGVIVHAIALAARVYILERPPVGTLYESLIFVALAVAVMAVAAGRFSGRTVAVLSGAVAALVLLAVSRLFAGDGDTMTVLTAVLNTNFWLATHVLCITLGYGWCVLTAFYAHLLLAGHAFRWRRFYSASVGSAQILALFSLLFTAIGTILGGIWADQSWGRFWGWDPKENGALLIVLWLVWLLHARLGNDITERGFLAGLAYLNVIVALSWIGVNLLGVGLHSYGFADGFFYGLGGFVAAEILLIGWLVRRARMKEITA